MEGDFPFVMSYQTSDNGKAESCPLLFQGLCVFGPIELLKDTGPGLLGDAQPGVPHLQQDLPPYPFVYYTHASPLGGVFDGVIYEVGEDEVYLRGHCAEGNVF